MIGPKLRLISVVALASLACLLLLADKNSVTRAAVVNSDIQTARTALQKYQDPIVAVRDGYFSTVACIDFPKGGTLGSMSYPAGGMGVHFLNISQVGAKLDPHHPQVLMYEPVAGKLQLVAAEWFVPMTPAVKAAPQMFGHTFYGPMMGHYPVMPASFTHYDLHVWLFKDNPAGMFMPTNADVKCPEGPYTFHDATPMMPMTTH